MNNVAIIGGGITGLTAAFRLRQRGIPVTLYEAGDRVGGVIRSIRADGYLAESGPNAILETSPKIGALIRDLGIEDRRVYSSAAAGKRYLVRGGKTIPLPESPLGLVSTPLFSAKAKLRLAAEPFVSRAPEAREENLAEFVHRRIGQEFLDYAINPFVAGVYAGAPDRLSVQHAFPRLYALEQRYGSLLVGQVRGARDRKRRAEVSKSSARKLSFDDGLQVLIDALSRQLADSIQVNARVTRLRQVADGWEVSAKMENCERSVLHAAVLFAGPAYRLPEIQLTTERYINCAPLSQITYPPVASVVLGFSREDVAHPLDGFGVLIPEVERFRIMGTIFSSTLFPNRSPAGHVTLTSYVGGMRAPELALIDAGALVELVLRDLRSILGVTGQPTFVNHVLFRRAIPQYEVGYGRFKELMNKIEARAPGLFLAGHYRDGISLGDSIVSGHNVSERIERVLADSPAQIPSAPAPFPSAIAA